MAARLYLKNGSGAVPMDALIERNRSEIRVLAAGHGVRNVRVFGSRARGDAAPTSDADFLVELDPGRDLFDLGELLMDLQDLLGCRVETLTEASLHPAIRKEVLREAVPI